MSDKATYDLWWKNAVIYCLDVELFCDSDGDGIGDSPGLTSKIDCLARLGVTCIWLMAEEFPFSTTLGPEAVQVVLELEEPRLVAPMAELLSDQRYKPARMGEPLPLQRFGYRWLALPAKPLPHDHRSRSSPDS